MEIVNTVEQLSELKQRWSSLPSVLHMPDYILDIPELTGQQNDAISRKINNKIKTCGCFVARLFLMFACCMLSIDFLIDGYVFLDGGLINVIMSVAIFAGSVMTFRALVILLARVLLIQLTNKTIQQALQARAQLSDV